MRLRARGEQLFVFLFFGFEITMLRATISESTSKSSVPPRHENRAMGFQNTCQQVQVDLRWYRDWARSGFTARRLQAFVPCKYLQLHFIED